MPRCKYPCSDDAISVQRFIALVAEETGRWRGWYPDVPRAAVAGRKIARRLFTPTRAERGGDFF